MENKFSEVHLTKKKDKSEITDKPENQIYQDLEKSKVTEILSKTGEAVNKYSPIKYKDDEEIIKDFKPISFKNIYGAGYYFRDEEKENIPNSKILSDSQMTLRFCINKNTSDRLAQTNVLASSNPIFDQRSSEIVRSAKQRLEDTEKLLFEKRKKVSSFL